MNHHTRRKYRKRRSFHHQLLNELLYEIGILIPGLRKKWSKWLTPPRHRLIITGLIACVIGLPLGDAFLYEPRNIELTTQYVPVKNLPRDLDGLRIVQLSDLHQGSTPQSIIAKSIDIANSTNPDIVVLTGDIVTRGKGNPGSLVGMLSKLNPKIGSYAILGNHDYNVGINEVKRTLEESGIHLLVNANAQPAEGFFIVGLDDSAYGKPDAKAAFNGVSQDGAYITLAHTPVISKYLRDRNGLLLTGHTHGGQIRFPFVSQYSLPGLAANKFLSGWYMEDQLMVYVNRGIGTTNIPARFLCRPEVTLFVLKVDYTELPRRHQSLH